MLRELHISNLAIIEDVQVEFDDALTVFTGATGAGKSLVIGALQLLLGTRPVANMVRAGASEGRASGVFVLPDKRTRAELSDLVDMPIEEEELLITRRLQAGGRSSCSVNGQPITVSMLQRLGERLVDIHGQYDHQFLMSPANQLLVLDGFAGCEPLREQIVEAYRVWQEHVSRRAELAENAELRRQQLELYEFQAAEIDQADAKPGELDDLDARHRRLANIDKIRQVTSAVHASLADDEGLLDKLRLAVHELRDLVRHDAQLGEMVASYESAVLGIQEATNDLRRYVDALDFDPQELSELDARLGLLRRLCDKYGGGMDELLAYRRRIEDEMLQLRQQQDDFSRVDSLIAEAQRRYDDLAAKLASQRRTAARKITKQINAQLAELGMDKAVFDMRIEQCEPGPTGRDHGEMVVQTNPGQQPAPLRRIASGGELSRIMLAIKSVPGRTDRSSVLVFDEVDAHVGGRLGSVIGEKLRALARRHQVICITHLPQIAAYATRHLKVAKATRAGQTRTDVRVIDGDDRIDELAEMIAGPNRTPTSIRQAHELLDRATGKNAAQRR